MSKAQIEGSKLKERDIPTRNLPQDRRVPEGDIASAFPIDETTISSLLTSVKKLEEYISQSNHEDFLHKPLFFPPNKSSLYLWIKESYRIRFLREKFFNPNYFSGEAAWNMILDLAVARFEGKRISITSACIASGSPPTTALRWISVLERDGIINRECDFDDKRRTFLHLSDKGMQLIASYYNQSIK